MPTTRRWARRQGSPSRSQEAPARRAAAQAGQAQAGMATDHRSRAAGHRRRAAGHRRRAAGAGVVERYRRPARLFHAGTYLSVLILLATGWWLLVGQEGRASPLAVLTGMPDISLHKLVGWIMAGLA